MTATDPDRRQKANGLQFRKHRKKFNIPSGNIFWVFAVSGSISLTNLENGSNRASVLAGDSLQTDVVFTAILGMGMTRERSSVRDLTGGGACESVGDLCDEIVCEFFYYMFDAVFLQTFISALRYLIGPHADASFTIVCKTGWALVTRGFAVPAVPENVALALIGEDSVQAGAVSVRNWGFWNKHYMF